MQETNPVTAFPRPRRLSDNTHALANVAMSGEYGRALVATPFDQTHPRLEGLAGHTQYAEALMLMAELAPLRIVPGEEIVGSATLREGALHATPGLPLASTSHTTLGFDRALQIGYKGLRAQIAERLSRGDLDDAGVTFLNALDRCLDAASVWHQRHLDLLDERIADSSGADRDAYPRVRENLSRVPENPPESFREAVQALWLLFAFQRLAGNWSGIGRIDAMLGPFLDRDLAEGRITLDEARDLIAHFWIKGCEWTGADAFAGSGDAQHYQNIVLAGLDANGSDIANEVTYLVLDVVEELHISDFPIAVRISSDTPDRLLRRIAEVQRHGGGIVAVYNDDIVLDGLVKFGYSLEEARGYANDGCWEVLMPGRTAFSYTPFDLLAVLHQMLGLHDDTTPVDYPDFESFYAAFHDAMAEAVSGVHDGADHAFLGGRPAPLISLLIEDCIEKARDYNDRGARYTVQSPHAGGMANVANSLATIKKLVYEDKSLSLPEFIGVLRADWAEQEGLRRSIVNAYPAYGNDDPEADAMMARLFNDYTDLVRQVPERNGVRRPAGISTFGREITWAHDGRTASPDGHHEGEVLATNFSPSPGTDRHGPTAVVKSYCKLDLTRVPCGATIELKMHPTSLQGEAGVDALVALMRSFVDLGGFFMQVDCVDTDLLRDAQAHPEKYPHLAVRISGWSARFATLSKEWQDMIINRTQQRL